MQKGIMFSFGVFLIVCVTRVKLTHTSHDKYQQIINPNEIKAIDMNEPWPFNQTLSKVDPSLDDLMVLANQSSEKVI
ncbi:hypothetical protein [Ekhidna sp.]|uniref:hypothetical protein n=1 Tax=Ekhidna sp. TaxID=2608089 RepID=UPI003CCBBF89